MATRKKMKKNPYFEIRERLRKLASNFDKNVRIAFVWDGDFFRVSVYKIGHEAPFVMVFDDEADYELSDSELNAEFVRKAMDWFANHE